MNNSFVLITRNQYFKFSIASVEQHEASYINDDCFSSFLYKVIDTEDLEAMAIVDGNKIPIASLWFSELQPSEEELASALITPPSGKIGVMQLLFGNLVITGPGDAGGNLTLLHPSRAFAFADALNASERIMLGPNAFMQTTCLPRLGDTLRRIR